MKDFTWYGIDKHGLRVNGDISAISKSAVVRILTQEEIFPCKIKHKLNLSFTRGNKIKSQEVIDFSRQLYNLIHAGIPIVRALTMLNSSTAKSMRSVIIDIKKELEMGSKLSEAFGKQLCFSGLFSNLIYIGEQTGTLGAMLLNIINYQEKNVTLKRKIKKALFYPLVVLFTAIIVVSIMLVWVIPQFEELYHSFGAQLPLYTKFIIHLSNQCRLYGAQFVLWNVLIIYILHLVRKRHLGVAEFLDAALLKLPFFGSIFIKSIVARIALILMIAAKSGISLVDALSMVEKTISNLVYKKALCKIRSSIVAGQSLSIAMQNSQLFPERMVQMINIGEESGSLSIMFSKITEFYESEVDYIVNNLSNLLEPIMMLVLGLIIGSLVCGMYLPIFRLGTIL